MKSRSAERLIAAKAIVRSSLICVAAAGPYGLVTITPSNALTSANIASIVARTVGSSTPESELNTIEPLWPLPNPPKCSSRASNPFRLSDAGISNPASEGRRRPSRPSRRRRRPTPIQMATTLRGLRKLQPPRRASTLRPSIGGVGRQNLMRPTDTHDANLLAPACCRLAGSASAAPACVPPESRAPMDRCGRIAL